MQVDTETEWKGWIHEGIQTQQWQVDGQEYEIWLVNDKPHMLWEAFLTMIEQHSVEVRKRMEAWILGPPWKVYLRTIQDPRDPNRQLLLLNARELSPSQGQFIGNVHSLGLQLKLAPETWELINKQALLCADILNGTIPHIVRRDKNKQARKHMRDDQDDKVSEQKKRHKTEEQDKDDSKRDKRRKDKGDSKSESKKPTVKQLAQDTREQMFHLVSALDQSSRETSQELVQQIKELRTELSVKPLPVASQTTLYTYSPAAKLLLSINKPLRHYKNAVLKPDDVENKILYRYSADSSQCEYVHIERAIQEWMQARQEQRPVAAPFNSLESKTEVIKIPSTDEHKQLRGQFGLFVKAGQIFEPDEFIGPYEGWCLEETEHFKYIGALQEVEFNAYAWSPSTRIKGKKLLVTAMGHFGNKTRYINDGRNLTHPKKSKKPNATFVEVEYQGQPYMAAKAIERIVGPAQIVANYGDDYWDSLEFIRARQAEQELRLGKLKALEASIAV